jgi:hypothetical protein
MAIDPIYRSCPLAKSKKSLNDMGLREFETLTQWVNSSSAQKRLWRMPVMTM